MMRDKSWKPGMNFWNWQEEHKQNKLRVRDSKERVGETRTASANHDGEGRELHQPNRPFNN